MKPAARLYAIFNHIEKYGDTSLVELAKIFSVSEMTIRRNVESLQTDGAVQIRLGVVSRGAKTSYEPPFSMRKKSERLQQLLHRKFWTVNQ